MDSGQRAVEENVNTVESERDLEVTEGQVTLASIIFDGYRLQIVGWKEARGWLASVFPAYKAVKDEEFERQELENPTPNYERDGLESYYELDREG